MGWSIKKPFGRSGGTVIGTALGAGLGSLIGQPLIGASIGGSIGSAFNKKRKLPKSPDYSGELSQMAQQEEQKRSELGQQQQAQINKFAQEQEKSAADYRKQLAANLATTAQQTFQQQNPYILQDLNARGLFTSQTARDEAQNRALQELATRQSDILSNYDIEQARNINELRGTGLSALLGGQQAGLDTAFELKKAAIQSQMDAANVDRQNAFAQAMASEANRNNLISSVLGLGGMLGANYLGSQASLASPASMQGTSLLSRISQKIPFGLGSRNYSQYSANPALNLYSREQLPFLATGRA
jgi:hypothetical protein